MIVLVVLLLYLVAVVVTALRIAQLGVAKARYELLAEAYLVQNALVVLGIVHGRVVADVATATHHVVCLRIVLESHLRTHLPLSIRDRV